MHYIDILFYEIEKNAYFCIKTSEKHKFYEKPFTHTNQTFAGNP